MYAINERDHRSGHTTCRLNVNIDHIATIRQARKTFEPSVVAAAVLADLAGANGITVHLRGDRSQIKDEDVTTIRSVVKKHINIEMAVTDEMIRMSDRVRPEAATLVTERADFDGRGRSVTAQRGGDVVVVDAYEPAAVARIVGRVRQPAGRVPRRVDPRVRGDVGQDGALAAAQALHDAQHVDEAVVVARVGLAVRPVVVVLAEIDARVVGVEQLLDQKTRARVARLESL